MYFIKGLLILFIGSALTITVAGILNSADLGIAFAIIYLAAVHGVKNCENRDNEK